VKSFRVNREEERTCGQVVQKGTPLLGTEWKEVLAAGCIGIQAKLLQELLDVRLG
jgi:hypothetical protein